MNKESDKFKWGLKFIGGLSLLFFMTSCDKYNLVRTNPFDPENENFTSAENVTDIDGNLYKTVTIGTQIWMAENLKTVKYNDGTRIPHIKDYSTWSGLSSDAYCWYDNDSNTYKNIYGALYNWFAINKGNLCPQGWHVPSNEEWTVLTTYLGGLNVAGGKLKETGIAHWSNPNSGATNESGFTALPGGCHYFDGSFKFIGGVGQWWSSSSSTSDYAFLREIHNDETSVHDGHFNKTSGYSVRCIKDDSITGYEVENAWKWFGGDDNVINFRNVGTGQSFTLDKNYTMTAVSLLFRNSPGLESYFDYRNLPEHTGHAVDIRVQLRNSNGEILFVTEEHLDSSFSGGWVRITWPSMIYLIANREYILTWYLKNGENLKLTNSSPGDLYAGFTLGSGFDAEISSGQNIDEWNSWSEHLWDFCFKIHGR